ncbi:hypothetical protein HHUSO_G3021 [Huso huso]|uniref:Secreted protein n=1 Tax=Huso huso TaxID=61971 RepID=A0ABR1A8K9_HUSHU
MPWPLLSLRPLFLLLCRSSSLLLLICSFSPRDRMECCTGLLRSLESRSRRSKRSSLDWCVPLGEEPLCCAVEPLLIS